MADADLFVFEICPGCFMMTTHVSLGNLLVCQRCGDTHGKDEGGVDEEALEAACDCPCHEGKVAPHDEYVCTVCKVWKKRK